MSVNLVVITGRLGSDPELRSTHSNKPVCNFSVATDRYSPNGAGGTDWHRVVVWDGQGTAAGQWLRKGDLVTITGRIQYRKWTDTNGQERTSTEIVARNVVFPPKDPQRPRQPANLQYQPPRPHQQPQQPSNPKPQYQAATPQPAAPQPVLSQPTPQPAAPQPVLSQPTPHAPAQDYYRDADIPF